MRIAFASGEGSSPIVFFRDHAGARKIRASRTVRKYSNPSSGVRGYTHRRPGGDHGPDSAATVRPGRG